jgi:hypothetical protein
MTGSYWNKFRAQRLSRRRMLAISCMTTASAALLAACGGGDEGNTDTQISELVYTPVDETKKVKPGGVYKGSAAFDHQHLDPHKTGTSGVAPASIAPLAA